MNGTEYECVKRKIRQLTSLNLDNYAETQMMRRLDGYIRRTSTASVAQYCQRLENDAVELSKLQDFLTINVSEFFRDAAHFDVLKGTVLPELLKRNRRLNIWSAGCSNGAEVYSVAMLLDQLSGHAGHRFLATDIDRNILLQAQNGGPYKGADVRNVPKALLDKYFTAENGIYRFSSPIRQEVVFKRQDLTSGIFETGFDLIICRNVVIYFTGEAKKKLKDRFVESLKPGGILFIGATETVLDANESGLRRLSPCFYRKERELVTMR